MFELELCTYAAYDAVKIIFLYKVFFVIDWVIPKKVMLTIYAVHEF